MFGFKKWQKTKSGAGSARDAGAELVSLSIETFSKLSASMSASSSSRPSGNTTWMRCLAALVIRRDYMCAMEKISAPTRAVHYTPGVYRFSTNVVVYALTHGGISNYSRYVPGKEIADEVSINAPTLIPMLE